MGIGKISGGLAGKILRVDLTNGKISTEDTEKYARRWLGGRAIASWLLLDETAPDTKWSDPENLLIFSPGCLVGTSSPAACLLSLTPPSAWPIKSRMIPQAALDLRARRRCKMPLICCVVLKVLGSLGSTS